MARHRHDPFKDLVGFLVGDVMYAVRIDVVREIVNPLGIVDLPRAPAFVKGVADYRGEVVPVIDLRERFGLPTAVTSRKTKWIVLDVVGGRNPNVQVKRQVFGGSGQSAASVVSGQMASGQAVAGQFGVPVMRAGQTGAPVRIGPGVLQLGAQAFGAPGRYGAPPASAGSSDGRPVGHGRYAALVVDSVTEVFGLAGGELRPAPPLGEGDDRRGIEGVTTLGSRLVFVLDARAFGPLMQAAFSPPSNGSATSSGQA